MDCATTGPRIRGGQGKWLLTKTMEPYLPRDVRGKARVDDRRVISGIVHVLRSGCRWCDCPPEYGPPTTIYNRFVRWARRGVWEDLFVLRHFPQLSRDFRVPPRRIAARFGAEHVDAVAPDLRRGERDLAGLPFGIHGWIQYQPEVWTPYARRFGHDV